jgi:hypothetical protein
MKHTKQVVMVLLLTLSVALSAGCAVKPGAFVEICADPPGNISCETTTFHGKSLLDILGGLE